MKTKSEIKRFVLAGNAVFTVHNQQTGNRFTYKVVGKGNVYFVRILTGPDNYASYEYLGTIFKNQHVDPTYRHGAKSRLSARSLGALAFRWFWERLISGQDFPQHFEFKHEGRCGRCARRLTVPQSIDSGYGPECIAHV